MTAVVPLARDAIDGPVPVVLIAASAIIFVRSKLETVWLIVIGSGVMLGVKMLN